MASAGGDLWALARQQVAAFEQRCAELQLTLAGERDTLGAQEREAKKLESERADFAKRAQEAEARAAAAAASAAELRTAAAKASGQHSLLQKHLEMLRGSLQEASTQMEADRQRYQQHLSQLRAAMQAYEVHLAQRQGGSAAGATEQEAADAVAAAAGQAMA